MSRTRSHVYPSHEEKYPSNLNEEKYPIPAANPIPQRSFLDSLRHISESVCDDILIATRGDKTAAECIAAVELHGNQDAYTMNLIKTFYIEHKKLCIDAIVNSMTNYSFCDGLRNLLKIQLNRCKYAECFDLILNNMCKNIPNEKENKPSGKPFYLSYEATNYRKSNPEIMDYYELLLEDSPDLADMMAVRDTKQCDFQLVKIMGKMRAKAVIGKMRATKVLGKTRLDKPCENCRKPTKMKLCAKCKQKNLSGKVSEKHDDLKNTMDEKDITQEEKEVDKMEVLAEFSVIEQGEQGGKAAEIHRMAFAYMLHGITSIVILMGEISHYEQLFAGVKTFFEQFAEKAKSIKSG